MKKEDKELLLIDLCARFPYGVIVYSNGLPHEQKLTGYIPDIEHYHIKPYLRPMSGMTEEEGKVYRMFIDFSYNDFTSESTQCVYVDKINDYLDWLNKHHFDYRGLIEKGLAIEAPEGMYDIK